MVITSLLLLCFFLHQVCFSFSKPPLIFKTSSTSSLEVLLVFFASSRSFFHNYRFNENINPFTSRVKRSFKKWRYNRDGVETSIGHTPDEFYNNLLEGVSGISEIKVFDWSNYPTRIAGETKTFSTGGWVAPKRGYLVKAEAIRKALPQVSSSNKRET
ncbi:unnamed protein product [Lactuca saligna]|uniref:beta-ketoacyl-[acyl-carrier-protein] synthase I n=1 Tax=Lactuca saligna TaxID=75948 RepID=A0AA35VFJ8_LACSI|nr:unnamed protein product [Lactuca saligna]